MINKTTRKDKLHNCIIVAIMFILMILPLLGFHCELERVIYLENRMAASKPVLCQYSIWSSEFTDVIEGYIEDRIGFREEMILSNVAIMYKLFNDFKVTNQIKGKQDNTFYINESILKCYQGTDMINESQMGEMVNRFCELDNSVIESGSDFYFFPIPNKENVYFEYMPDEINVISDQSMVFSIMNELRDNTEIKVVDVYSLFSDKKKENELIYYRNMDPTHWNYYGALLGYLELLKTINKANAKFSFRYTDIADWNIKKEEVHLAGDKLQHYRIIQKTFYDMKDYKYEVEPKAGYSGLKDETAHGYMHIHNNTVDEENTIAVVCDSYINQFMVEMLGENFSDVWIFSLGWELGDEEIAQIIIDTSPDILVYEVVERMTDYDGLLNSIERIQTILNYRHDLVEEDNICGIQ